MAAFIEADFAFALVVLLFAVYSILDGFALGIGCVVPFLRNKSDADKLVSDIAPFWEANEVWLIIAFGFTFAAFPVAYATLISSFYLPFMIVIACLVLRAASLEFSYHDQARVGFWRFLVGLGSFVMILASAALLGSVAGGLQFEGPGAISRDLTAQLSWFSLLSGATGLAVFVWLGILHSRHEILAKSAAWTWLAAVVLGLATVAFWIHKSPGLLARPVFLGGCLVFLSGLVLSRFLSIGSGWAFRTAGVAVAGLWLAIAASLFPDLLVSAGNPDWTLSIHQAAAPDSSMKIALMVSPFLIIVVACYSYLIQKKIRRHTGG